MKATKTEVTVMVPTKQERVTLEMSREEAAAIVRAIIRARLPITDAGLPLEAMRLEVLSSGIQGALDHGEFETSIHP